MGNLLSFQKSTVPFPTPTAKELKCDCLIDGVTDQVSVSMTNINKQHYFRTETELLRDLATRCHSLLCGLEVHQHSLPLRGVKSQGTANEICSVKFGSG